MIGMSVRILNGFHRIQIVVRTRKYLPTTVAATKTWKRFLGSQVPRPYVDPELSYAYAKSKEHLQYTTISREISKKLEQTPDEIAFFSHYENRQISFRQLNEDVNKLVKSLVTNYGIQRGDFVGVFSYNCYNWIVIQFACARIGAILTPVNPSYKTDELAFVLQKGKVKCLFMPGPKSVQSELNNHIEVLQSNQIIEMTRNKQLKLENVFLMDQENRYEVTNEQSDAKHKIQWKLHHCQLHNWNDIQSDGLLFGSSQEAEAAGMGENSNALILNQDLVEPDDLFAVYYTSGTTGRPKGACLSQFTVINNVRLCQNRLRNGRPRDFRVIVGTALPMFHIFAGVLNMLSPVFSNSVMVVPSYKYDIKALAESIIKYGANITTVTPTILIDLLTYVEVNKLSAEIPLKIIQPGGAALPVELVSRTFKLLPQLEEMRCGYGSTENGVVATFQTIHEPTESRAHTVGPPIDFTEVRVVKPETDHLVPLGEKGEIQTRGYNTMVEYLDEPEKTKEVLGSNRWYKTGDIGFMHPHGSIQIVGRLKHMIIKGGENIYPDEVEQMIHKLDYIEKVHIVGVPDERFGEQVCAWIKLKPGYNQVSGPEDKKSDRDICKQDIIDFCKSNITYFKVPKYLLFVDDFPMTPTKKVQNHIMIEQSIELLGLKKLKQ